jgi:hypothetical protein
LTFRHNENRILILGCITGANPYYGYPYGYAYPYGYSYGGGAGLGFGYKGHGDGGYRGYVGHGG